MRGKGVLKTRVARTGALFSPARDTKDSNEKKAQPTRSVSSTPTVGPTILDYYPVRTIDNPSQGLSSTVELILDEVPLSPPKRELRPRLGPVPDKSIRVSKKKSAEKRVKEKPERSDTESTTIRGDITVQEVVKTVGFKSPNDSSGTESSASHLHVDPNAFDDLLNAMMDCNPDPNTPTIEEDIGISDFQSVGAIPVLRGFGRRLSLSLNKPKPSVAQRRLSINATTRTEVETKLEVLLKNRALFEKRDKLRRQLTQNLREHIEFIDIYNTNHTMLENLESDVGAMEDDATSNKGGDDIAMAPFTQEGIRPPSITGHKAKGDPSTTKRLTEVPPVDTPGSSKPPQFGPFKPHYGRASKAVENGASATIALDRHADALASNFLSIAQTRFDVENQARKNDKAFSDICKNTLRVYGHNTIYSSGEEKWLESCSNILLYFKPYMPVNIAKACEAHLICPDWSRYEHKKKDANGRVYYPCSVRKQKMVPLNLTFCTPAAPKWIMGPGLPILQSLHEAKKLPRSVRFEMKHGTDTQRMQMFVNSFVGNLNSAFAENNFMEKYPELSVYWSVKTCGPRKCDLMFNKAEGDGWDTVTIRYSAIPHAKALERFWPVHTKTGRRRAMPVDMGGPIATLVHPNMAVASDFGIEEIVQEEPDMRSSELSERGTDTEDLALESELTDQDDIVIEDTPPPSSPVKKAVQARWNGPNYGARGKSGRTRTDDRFPRHVSRVEKHKPMPGPSWRQNDDNYRREHEHPRDGNFEFKNRGRGQYNNGRGGNNRGGRGRGQNRDSRGGNQNFRGRGRAPSKTGYGVAPPASNNNNY